MNGGTCNALQSGGYICACPSCYAGTNCQTCNLFIFSPSLANIYREHVGLFKSKKNIIMLGNYFAYLLNVAILFRADEDIK